MQMRTDEPLQWVALALGVGAFLFILAATIVNALRERRKAWEEKP